MTRPKQSDRITLVFGESEVFRMNLNLRRWRAVLLAAVLFVVLLLPGCGAADSSPASSGQTAISPAEDGKLRLLYNPESCVYMPFRGMTPLETGEDENAWLLYDYASGEDTHYATRTTRQGESHYRIYDPSGSLVLDCGTDTPQ